MKKKTGIQKSSFHTLCLMCVFLMFSTVTVSAGTNVLTSAKSGERGKLAQRQKRPANSLQRRSSSEVTLAENQGKIL